MRKCFSSLSESSDYFKEPFKMIFNKKKMISTGIGKVLSFLIYSITIALIASLGSDIYLRINPITTQISKVLASAPIINMTNRNLVLMTQFSDKNFKQLDDSSIFTVEISQFVVNRENGNSTFNYYPVNRTDCKNYKEYFKKNNFSLEFESNNLEVGFCFDIFNKSISIGGAFTQNYFSNINYKLKRCINSTESEIVCKSPEVIEETMNNGYFGIIYIDNYIDTDNFKKPAVPFFSNYFIKTDPKLFKFVDIYFRMAELFTDAGLIFESKESESIIMYDNAREQISLIKDNLLVDFYFNISQSFLKVSRVYMKLQTLAATIGGIFKVLIVVSYMMTVIFSELKTYEYLINFLFESDEEIVSPIRNNHIPIIMNSQFLGLRNLNNLKDSSSSIIYKRESKNINDSDKSCPKLSKIPFVKNKQKCFKETFSIKFLNICSEDARKKKKIFENSYENLIKYLDFIRISLMVQEFRQLKKIIFDENQKLIFNFMKRPRIMEKKKSPDKNLFLHREKVFTSYKCVYEKQNDDVNKRLIENMREDLKDRLNKIV